MPESKENKMNSKTIKKCVSLCEEFIFLSQRVEEEQMLMEYWTDGNGKRHQYTASGTKLTGSLRRKSMDLTRALSEMRKS